MFVPHCLTEDMNHPRPIYYPHINFPVDQRLHEQESFWPGSCIPVPKKGGTRIGPWRIVCSQGNEDVMES